MRYFKYFVLIVLRIRQIIYLPLEKLWLIIILLWQTISKTLFRVKKSNILNFNIKLIIFFNKILITFVISKTSTTHLFYQHFWLSQSQVFRECDLVVVQVITNRKNLYNDVRKFVIFILIILNDVIDNVHYYIC